MIKNGDKKSLIIFSPIPSGNRDAIFYFYNSLYISLISTKSWIIIQQIIKPSIYNSSSTNAFELCLYPWRALSSFDTCQRQGVSAKMRAFQHFNPDPIFRPNLKNVYSDDTLQLLHK